MFRIPAFNQFETSFDEAKTVITSYGRGDLLEGMKAMNRVWDEHCASYNSDNARFDSDADFCDYYEAEINAFNVVFKEMGKLFG